MIESYLTSRNVDNCSLEVLIIATFSYFSVEFVLVDDV